MGKRIQEELMLVIELLSELIALSTPLIRCLQVVGGGVDMSVLFLEVLIVPVEVLRAILSYELLFDSFSESTENLLQ